MRLRRSRLAEYYHKKKTIEKDREGGTSETFGSPSSFSAEVWPAGGKLQAEMYGERLSYIRNVRMNEAYTVTTDEKGIAHYIIGEIDLVEGDGICLDVPAGSDPDYKVISIRPDRFLRMEVEKRR
jgi:hypothetical protein